MLQDASDNSAITLSPSTFVSSTTSYTASEANDVDEITVLPTVNESNATYEIQDGDGTALVDADSATGFQVALSEGENTVNVKVTAEDTSATETYTVVVTRLRRVTTTPAAPPEVTVPDDWPLIPAGLVAGDQFRLIFLSSTKTDGTSYDIADYNTFIQGRAAAGHTDIRTYSSGFRAVGCTPDTDARDNTATTGAGVVIHWLNGNQVADDYADFYNGNWDEERNSQDKNELGANGPNTSQSANYPLTGCDDDGTEDVDGGTSYALGESEVRLARPGSGANNAGPLTSNSDTAKANTRPMYGLSQVFEVVAPPTVTISADRTSAVLKGDSIVYTLTRTGSTAAALPVTVALTQTRDFLGASDLGKTVTFGAGESTKTFTVSAASFQDFAPGATVAGGTLTATVQAGTGYDPGTPASVDVTMVVALTIGFELSSYTIAEEDGLADGEGGRADGRGGGGAGCEFTLPGRFGRSWSRWRRRRSVDYTPITARVTLVPSDFTADGSVFKAEGTVSVTIHDDAADESDERFNLFLLVDVPPPAAQYRNFVTPSGAACQVVNGFEYCATPITITDTDPVAADITGIGITSTPASGSYYGTGETVTVAVTYDEAVVVDTASGTPTLGFQIGGVTKAASYTGISSDNLVLTFSYTIAGTDQDQQGISISSGSIDLAGGAITRQGAGDAANLVYPGTRTHVNHKVNKDPAVVSGGVAVTSSPVAATDTYGVGETIRFTVTFDTPVAVDTSGGTPRLRFRLANSGNPANRDLDYVSGSGTAVLTFEYAVQSGDTDNNGIRDQQQLAAGERGHDQARDDGAGRESRPCPSRQQRQLPRPQGEREPDAGEGDADGAEPVRSDALAGVRRGDVVLHGDGQQHRYDHGDGDGGDRGDGHDPAGGFRRRDARAPGGAGPRGYHDHGADDEVRGTAADLHGGGDARGGGHRDHLRGRDDRGVQGRRHHLHADAQRLDHRPPGRLGHADADQGFPGDGGSHPDGDDRRGPVDADLHGRGLQLPVFRGGDPGRGRHADRGDRGRHRLRPGDDVLGRCGHRHRRDGLAGCYVLVRGGGGRHVLVQGGRAHGRGRAPAECHDGHDTCVVGK